MIPEGLEPPTYRLGICRSILMSYGITWRNVPRNVRVCQIKAQRLRLRLLIAVFATTSSGAQNSSLTALVMIIFDGVDSAVQLTLSADCRISLATQAAGRRPAPQKQHSWKIP